MWPKISMTRPVDHYQFAGHLGRPQPLMKTCGLLERHQGIQTPMNDQGRCTLARGLGRRTRLTVGLRVLRQGSTQQTFGHVDGVG